MSRILTLNLGASKATLAEYNVGKGAPVLVAYGSAGLAVDLGDPVSVGAALPVAIHQIMREKGIKPGPTVVSLGGQAVFPRFAKITPSSDAARLEQLVRYEIEQNVPFPIDEIVSDYQFTGDTPDGDRAAVIVAAKIDAVRAVTDAVRSAGLKPVVVDVSPMAVLNALKFSEPGIAGCTVVLDMGAKTTSLIIVEDEKVYNRSIPTAGNTITKEIAQTFGCSFEEAEQLKIERGYVSLGGVTEDEDEITDRVSKVIRTVLTRLHAEISRSINFYRSQQGGSAPVRLFLTGGSVRLPQLAEFFQETLQIEVGYLNPFSRVKTGSKIAPAALENDAFVLAESVGLSLRAGSDSWISINLMPPELIDEARAMRRIPIVAAGGVAFIAALGLGWLAESRNADVANECIARVESRNGSLRGFKTKLEAGVKAADSARDKADAFQRLVWGRSAALVRLDTVRKSLIRGMWITEWAPLPKDKEAKDDLDRVRVTVRGWRDVMTKAEAEHARSGKQATAGEIVQQALMNRKGVIEADSVKIVSQKDVKEAITEFSIEMAFCAAPSAAADASKGKKGKK